MLQELLPDKLRRKLDSSVLNFDAIVKDYKIKPLVGQDRALKALEFGIGNKNGGFNIYISGYPGSGKLKAVNYFLSEKASLESPPGDWCYVNNFKDPYYPKRISLPQGNGVLFKKKIFSLVDHIKKSLIKAFESKEYEDKRQKIIDNHKEKEIELFKDIYEKAKESNFTIRRTPIEIIVIPTDESGNPIMDKKFRELNKKKQEEILKKQKQLKEELLLLLRKNFDLEKESNFSLLQLEKNVALYVLDTLLQELFKKYKDFIDVIKYLEDIKKDIINNLGDFLDTSKFDGRFQSGKEKRFLKYEVNVITDNTDVEGAPIIMEMNPTYNNLFGKVEHESDMGTLITNFTLIRGGSLHKANGGYLIIPVKDLLSNYFSYECLKRALKNNEVVIEDMGERLGFLSAKSLKPDPIPLNVQVILIGSPSLYYLLYEYDEDFKELFKVKAEFDTSMENTVQNLKDFVTVINKIEKENDLLPLSEKAMACIIEHASRMVEDQNKLSIKFGEISNILFEAQHYASIDSSKNILLKHIEKTIDAKYFRSNLIQEKINEMIKRNQLLISLSGLEIGQINGISVLNLGDIMFGKPNKITATVATGKEGLVDIEREAKLGGPIHTKGVLILLGYLVEKYAQNKPISLFASLVFEQSYSEIEGDSASSAELYAILSSLSQLPIKQGIAVTGSVNQKGEVQPVGAINEKIEGYFDVCNQFGLTGEQGVIIPKSNEQNLMLKKEIIEAVNNGKFHVWSVSIIDEGIEILFGRKAGKQLKNKSFSKNSVHYMVDKRINELNETIKDFGQTEEKK